MLLAGCGSTEIELNRGGVNLQLVLSYSLAKFLETLQPPLSMSKLKALWEIIRSSLWFIPTLIVLSLITLALALVNPDSFYNQKALSESWPRLFGAHAEGARGLLAAIASSMINIAGVTFSITIVALALASSQYTSRILRNFVRDRANQTVLGIFVGVFAYAIVVLRSIRGGVSEFVPQVAVLVGVVLGLLAIGALIFFIHHIAASIQAANIIEGIARETLETISRLFPLQSNKTAESSPSAVQAAAFKTPHWVSIPALCSGYIQSVDVEAISRIACELKTVIKLEKALGDFVIRDGSLFQVAAVTCDSALTRRLNDACVVGSSRTMQQDFAYGIRQLVDIALKALSPGVNDTTTAINCVDYLTVIVASFAARPLDGTVRMEGAHLRVLGQEPSFPTAFSGAFDQIRQNAQGNVAVLTRLLQAFSTIKAQCNDVTRQNYVLSHATLVAEMAERTVPCEFDRKAICGELV